MLFCVCFLLWLISGHSFFTHIYIKPIPVWHNNSALIFAVFFLCSVTKMPDPSLAAGVRLQPEVPVMLTWTRCLLLHPPGLICSLYLQTSAMHSCHLLANNSRVPISGERASSENPKFGAPELPANFLILHRNQKGPQWILQNSENILLRKIPH